jgi:hypothetical protein
VKYESLYSKSKSQDQGKVFAKFFWPNGKPVYEPFLRIAAKTSDGESGWGFKQQRFKDKYSNPIPKLYNYLDYTFLRLQELDDNEQNKFFIYSDDKSKVCFNSGLQDTYGNDLILSFQVMQPLPGYIIPKWKFSSIFTPQNENYISIFGHAAPEIVWYTKDSRDYVFNLEYSLNTELHEHVFYRAKDRSGFSNFSDEVMRNYLCGVISNILPKIKRNYKVAIPVYYVKEHKMQLLLPFHTNAGKAALLVERDDNHRMYIIKTVLDMDQAYFAARLLTRPDNEWLDP